MEQTNMPVAYAAGYSLTASTTSSHRITLERRKYITAIECHIPAQTGGPAWIRLTLERGLNRMTLTEGYVSAKHVIEGTGQLPLNVENANILLEYTNTTASAVVVDVNIWASDKIDEGTQPGWNYDKLTWEDAPMLTQAISRGAAGTQYGVQTVTTGKKIRIYGLGFANTTDANAADRYPILRIANGGTLGADDRAFMATTPQTASIASQTWSFAPGYGQSGVIGANMRTTVGCGLPVELTSAAQWQLFILNIQATDRPDGSMYVAYKELPV